MKSEVECARLAENVALNCTADSLRGAFCEPEGCQLIAVLGRAPNQEFIIPDDGLLPAVSSEAVAVKNIGSIMLETSFYACLFACWNALSAVTAMPEAARAFYTLFLVLLVIPWHLATHVRLSIIMALGATCALVVGILELSSIRPARLHQQIGTHLATTVVAALSASVIFLSVACVKRFLSRALKNFGRSDA